MEEVEREGLAEIMDCICVFYDKNNAKLHVVKPNGKSITRLKEVFGEEAEELYELLTDQTADTWIPLTTRQMTSEEREYYKQCDSDVIYDCPLPEDGQVVLITDKYGNVETDTFFKEDTCYFDCNDMEDVVAWRPLPTPYRKGE